MRLCVLLAPLTLPHPLTYALLFAASAAAGVGCLAMAECDVTTQGECAIVITQRVSKKRGPGESMLVEVFSAKDNHDQREWIQQLQTSVARELPKTFDGIPYGALRLAALSSNACVTLRLEVRHVVVWAVAGVGGCLMSAPQGMDMRAFDPPDAALSILTVPANGIALLQVDDDEPISCVTRCFLVV